MTDATSTTVFYRALGRSGIQISAMGLGCWAMGGPFWRGDKAVGNIERFAFYEEAKTAYCIISTSEKALYANIMLQKGVVINN